MIFFDIRKRTRIFMRMRSHFYSENYFRVESDAMNLLLIYERHTGQIRDDSIVTKTKKVDSH